MLLFSGNLCSNGLNAHLSLRDFNFIIRAEPRGSAEETSSEEEGHSKERPIALTTTEAKKDPKQVSKQKGFVFHARNRDKNGGGDRY